MSLVTSIRQPDVPRLVKIFPQDVTLNDLERRNGLILRYFAELGSFQGPFPKCD